MKWNNADKKELNNFSNKYLFSKGDGDWEAGILVETKSTQSGKFMTIDISGMEAGGYKYWASPEAPDEKP